VLGTPITVIREALPRAAGWLNLARSSLFSPSHHQSRLRFVQLAVFGPPPPCLSRQLGETGATTGRPYVRAASLRLVQLV
jgi:hypothetical protein